MSKLPLEGIRVTDTTNSWAGPYAMNLLANLGAEVIKIEAIQRLDIWRGGSAARPGLPDAFWERSPTFNSANTDKLGITLNLRQPKGVEIFKRLVKISDIVTENFSPRVMKNFGLDYPVLKEVNPAIIMISLPAHGATGPYRDFVGYAFSIEQMAGLPQLHGFPNELPKMTTGGFSDPGAGLHGMMAVMFALLYRQMTGKGQYIDLSQIEAMTCLIGDAIVDYTMNKRVQLRRGNRHPSMSPHGYYRCKGDDLWVSIAVSSDADWQRFAEAIGNPPWTRADRFMDSFGRWQNADELDRLVEEWTIRYDRYQVTDTLQMAGVAAGPVLIGAELLSDPGIKERGTFQMVERAIVGRHPYAIPTAPMRFSKVPVKIRRPAPLVGEHNDYVFGELLGMSKEEIQSLADEQIIGSAPLMI